MSGIQAFVAHSFSEGDKPLIATFVEYFDSLEGLLPGFGWDHALQAEPQSLADKVLAKIEGKNVFIGICTGSECVVAPSAISKIPFLKMMTFSQSARQWKTSDWIIQEIGLAGHAFNSYRREERVQRPAKVARSAPRPPFGLPELTVAVQTSLLSCRKAGKTRVFTPVRESSGESRLILRMHILR